MLTKLPLSFAILIAWLLTSDACHAAAEDLRFMTVSRAPHSRVKPGGLVVLTAKVSNRGNDLAEAVVIAKVDGQQDRQSARRVLVRGLQESQYEIYVHLPKSIAGKKTVEVELTLIADEDGREVILKRDGAAVSYTVKLTVGRLATHAGLLMPPEPQRLPDWYWPTTPMHGPYELSVATRLEAGNTRQTANYDLESPPIGINDLQGLDVFIVSDEVSLQDASTKAALKQFASNGGRLWLMLDELSDSAIQHFLSPGQSLAVVDEVRIDNFVVDVNNPNVRLAEKDRTVKLRNPATFKRVVQSGGSVLASVEGWPIIVSMPSGYGETIISTLQPEAWLQPRTGGQATSPLLTSPYQARPWAIQLSSELNDIRRPLPMHSVASEYPLKHIGNPIVPRSWVAATLLAFCVLVGLSGLVKFLGVDFLWIGVAAPVLALLFGSALLIASTTIRSDKVDSVSRLQIVEFSGDGTAAHVREQAAVYLNGNAAMNLVSKREGMALAEGVSSGVTRFVTEDFGAWTLSNDNWRSGTWRYDAEFTLNTSPQFATAELTDAGIRITPPAGLPGGLSDPILGYVAGDLMLCSSSGDGLLCDGSLVADGTRWIDAALVTDEQQRRMEVYSSYFSFDERTRPLERMLFGWTDTWKSGPQWDQELLTQGSALVALPLRIQQPPAGEEIYVPHGLIKLRRSNTANGQTFSYNELTGEWVEELTIGATAGLELHLPPEVLPMKIDAIDISLDISAPKRNVVLYAFANGQKQEIAKLTNPSLPASLTIRDPALLAAFGTGKLTLELAVSERTDVQAQAQSANVVAWGVRHLRASVRGRRTE